jgi:ABC-type multidrug transport system fused ATPase/permease subunit
MQAAPLLGRAHVIMANDPRQPSPSLWRVVKAIAGFRLVCTICLSCTWGILATVGKPLCVKLILNAAASGDAQETLISLAIFIAAMGLESFMQAWMAVFMDELAMDLFSTISSLILEKSMRLAPGQGGNEAGLISDMNRNVVTAPFIGMMFGCFMALSAGLALLVYLVSWPGAVGFVFLLLLGKTSTFLSGKSQIFARKHLAAADARLTLTKQMVEGVKAVKFLTWEQSYLDLINKARNSEVVHIRKYRTVMVIATTIGRTSTMLAAALCFGILVTANDDVDVSDVYTALAVFLSLRLPMITLPWSIMLWEQLKTCLSRTQAYLDLPEAKTVPTLPEGHSAFALFKSAGFKWPGASQQCLKGVNLTIDKGTMVAVIGPVGSGKSSFLTAIIGGLEVEFDGGVGRAEIAADAQGGHMIGYVPQTPIVISGTVRENIVMNCPFDLAHFNAVIRACSMKRDLDLLPHAADTDIGENGVTLSGGQKSRLGVARALYAKPKVLIVDDPLAAVDPVVAQEMFQSLQTYVREGVVGGNGSEGGEGGVTLVMALNQLQLLSSFDEVVLLNEGVMEAKGAPAALQETCPAFAELVEKFGKQQQEASPEDAQATDETEGRAKSIKMSKLGKKLGPTEKKSLEEKLEGAGAGEGGKIVQSKTNELVKVETKKEGEVGSGLYMKYFTACGWYYVLPSLMSGLAGYAVNTMMDIWMNEWIKQKKEGASEETTNFYMIVYASAAVAFLVLLMTFSVVFARGCAQASRTVHEQTIRTLMHAPITW